MSIRIKAVHVAHGNSYITVLLQLPGYNKFHIHALVDTGSTYCLARHTLLPSTLWTPLDKPVQVTIGSGENLALPAEARNIRLFIGGEKFLIPSLLSLGPTITSGPDLVLGNEWLMFHAPIEQTPDYYKFRCHTRREINKTVVFAYAVKPKDAYAIFGNSTLLHDVFKKRSQRGDRVPPLESLSIMASDNEVTQLLHSISSDKPLEWWNKQKPYADLELLDPTKEIREKPMVYTPSDVEEFSTQINELLSQGLIRASYSPHTSPAFLVRNHAEIKRGKARMVINYKKVNEATKMDGYFLPNKERLIAAVRGKHYFSKFDCKSGFWQIRLLCSRAMDLVTRLWGDVSMYQEPTFSKKSTICVGYGVQDWTFDPHKGLKGIRGL